MQQPDHCGDQQRTHRIVRHRVGQRQEKQNVQNTKCHLGHQQNAENDPTVPGRPIPKKTNSQQAQYDKRDQGADSVGHLNRYPRWKIKNSALVVNADFPP